jgi:hypothetical protein
MLLNRLLMGASPFALLSPEGTGGGGGADPGAGGGAPGGTPGGAPGGGSARDPAAGGGDPKAAPGTIAGGTTDPAGGGAPAPKPGFPENWRELLAGEDKDAIRDLAKYTDPNNVYKSLRELQAKISKGELKAPPKPLPANATEEQKAAWRKENGLPESAEAYVKDLALPDGVVVGEADKPLLQEFAKAMFEGGATQAEMNRAVGWFYQMQEQMEASRADADSDFHAASEAMLRDEWKQDFKPNMNAFGAFRAKIPEDVQALIFSSRTVDGQMLGDHPAFLKLGALIGRELNPAATVVTTGPGDIKTIESEIAAIEKSIYDERGNPNPDYWKGDAGARAQARYRELIDARDKLTQKGRAA